MNSARPFSAALWVAGRNLADPQLSPTDKSVTFVTTGGERAELAQLPVPGNGEEGVEEWLPLDPPIKRGTGVHVWVPDASGIVYLGADGCVYRYDFATATTFAITVQPEPVASLAIAPDGEHVVYVIDTQHVVVVAVDGSTATPQRLSSGADFAFDPSWSADSQYVAWHEWDVPNMPWDGGRIVVRRANGQEPIVTVAGGDDISVQQPRFSPDGHYLSFLSDANGWLNVWVADAQTFSDARPLIEEAYEHGPPAWGPGQRSYCWTNDSRNVVFTRNDRGVGRLCSHELSTAISTTIADASFSALSASNDHVVGVSSGPKQATRLDLVAIAEPKTTSLARASLAELERAGIEPEQVSWLAEDGATVYGRLYRTQNSADALPPLLLWMHGGPAGQSPATLFARWCYFLQRGWSVLVVDYRGSTGWGRAFAQALHGRWGELDVTDSAAGAMAAVANNWADPRRIVAAGSSSAGTTTLLLLAHYAELFAAGVALYPISDLTDFEEETWRFEAHYFDRIVGSFPERRDVYEARSPINHVSAITKPVLLLHGDSDEVVSVNQSLRMTQQMELAGCTVESHIYEGEGHGWKKPSTHIDELERVGAFLGRYVLHGGSESREQK